MAMMGYWQARDLRAQRMTFRFSNAEMLRAFEPEKRYRVHYIAHYPLPLLLSAERLDV